MTKRIQFLILLGLVVVFHTFCVTDVEAHGTAYRVIGDATVVTVEFYYSDKEPMRYAEVLVYSPKDAKIEFQNGRTDRNGRFCFCPDATGTWRMEVKDGTGHNVKSRVEVIKNSEGGLEVLRR